MSLFKADQAVLSNDEIRQILGTRIYPPAHARLAVLRLGAWQQPAWWTEDLAQMDQQASAEFLRRLRGSPRVSDALVLPSLLMPQQMTIPHLREAAARVQADLLLVYRTVSRSYQKSRLLGPDATRAYCTAEAVLLDTRSGIVLTTAIATENFSADKSGRDLTFDETIARAEQRAAGRAMANVAAELADYLSNAPTPDTRPAATQPAAEGH
jgi:hypothetical protein